MYKKIKNLITIDEVYAHCDVPCGLYDPQAALMAANTVRVMVKQIRDIEKSDQYLATPASIQIQNDLTRRILTKEQHAELCKKEVLILWTDYFKEEDLSTVPNLHEEIWKTVKLCSYNKQNVDAEKAEELYSQVELIADMFNKVVEQRKSK